jgi:ribosomal protein S18 acetylase RimI-like enzyme
MADARSEVLTVETEPSSATIRFLEERLYEFNVQATGFADGEAFGIFLRGGDGAVVGGAEGWTWGGTCYVRHLYLPAALRGRGQGTRLMQRVEQEARARRCDQIVLETHDFQAPDFYRRLGFELIGTIEGYPRGHQRHTFAKKLGK